MAQFRELFDRFITTSEQRFFDTMPYYNAHRRRMTFDALAS